MKTRNTSTVVREVLGKSACLAVLTSAVFASGAAWAQDADLQMDLVGTIDPRCEFVQFNAPSADFAVQSSTRIDFSLYCNLPMSIDLASQNGGLVNDKMVARLGMLPELARPYDVVLSLDSGDFRRETDSIAMQDGETFDTGDLVVFDTNGALDVTLRESLEGSYAGTYEDVISITLAPSLAILN